MNNSVVNQLEHIVPNKRMSFAAKNIGVFRYQYMLSNPMKQVELLSSVTDLYNDVEKQYRYSISFYDDDSNFAYIRDNILKQFDEICLERLDVCDILVKYLFHSKNSRRKNVFWMCFGDIVLETSSETSQMVLFSARNVESVLFLFPRSKRYVRAALDITHSAKRNCGVLIAEKSLR